MSVEDVLAKAYGNLCATTGGYPLRSAFQLVAIRNGMTYAEFQTWAKDLSWR